MNSILEVFLVLVPMILSLTVHEYFHARTALWLGDDTAAHMGRLTLNPVAHVDLFGTILLPALAIISNSSLFFGWAKPVPVNPVRFVRRFFGRRITMRMGMVLTSAAGPLSNLVFGFLCAALLKVLIEMEITSEAALMLPLRLLLINYVLAIFNLIPIPPLDGSKVLAGFLPRSMLGYFDALERSPFLSLVVLMGLLGTGVLGRVMGPIVELMFRATAAVLGLGPLWGF